MLVNYSIIQIVLLNVVEYDIDSVFKSGCGTRLKKGLTFTLRNASLGKFLYITIIVCALQSLFSQHTRGSGRKKIFSFLLTRIFDNFNIFLFFILVHIYSQLL